MALTFVASAENFADAAGTTLDCSSSLNVQAGDLLVAWCKHEGTNGTFAVASSVGTNNFIFDAADEENHSSLDLNASFGYRLSAVADAAATFRLTTQSKEFRGLIVWQFRPDTGEVCTKVAAAEGQGTGTSAASGGISPSDGDLVVFGGFAHFDAITLSNRAINGVAADAFEDAVATDFSSWYRILTTGFTNGTATVTQDLSIDWICNIIAFQAIPGNVSQISFVNSTALTFATAASTWSIATHSSKVGGAAFVVGLGPASSAVTVSTVTDNAGNTYLLAARALSPIPAASAELWYATNISSASTRISVTLSGNSSGSMGVGQWNGISTGTPLLSTAYGAITANSTVHSFTESTPSSDGALVVGFYRCHASTMSPTVCDGGFSQWITTGAAVRTMGLYTIQGAKSTVTAPWRTNAGSSGGVQHSGVFVAFSDTAGTPPAGGDYIFWGGFTMMGVQ